MAKPTQTKQKNLKPLKQYIKYSTIGFQMIALVVGGTLLGNWLDETYNNDGFAFTVTLALASVFLALYLALKDLIKPTQ